MARQRELLDDAREQAAVRPEWTVKPGIVVRG
jgi:hypothetical protein